MLFRKVQRESRPDSPTRPLADKCRSSSCSFGSTVIIGRFVFDCIGWNIFSPCSCKYCSMWLRPFRKLVRPGNFFKRTLNFFVATIIVFTASCPGISLEVGGELPYVIYECCNTCIICSKIIMKILTSKDPDLQVTFVRKFQ